MVCKQAKRKPPRRGGVRVGQGSAAQPEARQGQSWAPRWQCLALVCLALFCSRERKRSRAQHAVVEHVSEVAAAPAAAQFRAKKQRGDRADRLDALETLGVGRPAGAALELLVRREQRRSATGADKGAGALLFRERRAVRGLGSALTKDVVLAARERRLPVPLLGVAGDAVLRIRG
eukprot:scaffold1228_cov115-Isochrysis_galbana.AAC.13